MLRVDPIEPEPLDELRYLNAAPGGGTEVRRFPLLQATIHGLPAGLGALIVASDLQGIVPGPQGEPYPLGVALAARWASLAEEDRIPRVDRVGVLLAGDLYSVPTADKRGGFGDVAPVWQAFAQRFRWVAGVAGNHDDVSRFARRCPGGVHLLDGAVVDLDGLTIGGVGLIAGNPRKPGRREEGEQLALVELVAEAGPDVLVLHEGPDGGAGQPGSPDVAELLAHHRVPFTVCGHVHWRDALAAGPAGQVLNLEGRAILLTPPYQA